MDSFHCEICNVFIKPKNKSRYFKSNNHKNLAKHKHIKLTIDNPNLDNIDKLFHTHNNDNNNKYEYYLVRCEFKLVFSKMEGYAFAFSTLTDNTTMISWKIFVENVINNY